MDPLHGGDLQKLADYYKVRWHMRTASRGAIGAGLFILALGLIPRANGSIDSQTVAVGILIAGEGYWQRRHPKPERYLVEGILLLLLAAWNITWAVSNLRGGAVVVPGFVGFFALAAGVNHFLRYPNARRLFREGFTEEEVDGMRRLVENLRKARTKDCPDVIAFQAGQGQEWRWKAQLGGGTAVLLNLAMRDILVVPRDALTIVPSGKVWLGNNLKAKFDVKGRRWRGRISPESFARYEEWKGIARESAAGEPGSRF